MAVVGRRWKADIALDAEDVRGYKVVVYIEHPNGSRSDQYTYTCLTQWGARRAARKSVKVRNLQLERSFDSYRETIS